MILDILTQIYPTDKCIQFGHNYIPGYSQVFSPVKESTTTVLEIGIGCGPHETAMKRGCAGFRAGNSLRMWRDYFLNAQIYGADILPSTVPDTEERITTVIADQSSEKDLVNLAILAGGKFDIIIDDGSHYAQHQQFSFSVLEKYLAENGIYVIEDVQPEYIEQFKNLAIFPPAVQEIICAKYDCSWFDTREQTGIRDDFLMVFKRRIQPAFFFVILRNIGSEENKDLWWRSYSSIRTFYPTVKIIVIDDNSILSDNRDILTTDTVFEKSEFSGAGELIPYYRFSQEKWKSNLDDKMIFLHDSMFLIRPFTTEELSGDIRFLWHFEQHQYDDDARINGLLAHMNNSAELVNMNSQKHIWNGCFGIASICSLSEIKQLEDKYLLFSKGILLTKNRDDRMAMERIFGLLCFHSGLVNLEKCSVFGKIHDYHGCWQADYEWQMKNKQLYPYAVLKTWNGR